MCYGPKETALAELVRVAGMRWTIEECLETAKGEVELDQYEVRRWVDWDRHIPFALLAHAFLAVTRAEARRGSGNAGPGASLATCYR